MLKHQSVLESSFLATQQPLSSQPLPQIKVHALHYNESNEQIEQTKMQLLTRQLMINLTKNALKRSPAAAIGAKNAEFLQNFSTERPQQKLLRFPAFPLDETLAKFLKTAQPFLNKAEFEETKAMLDQFRSKDGAKLQKLLEKTAQKEENWLAKRWLQTAYMQYRDPVTVYSSPGMSFPLREFKDSCEYLQYAGKVIFHLIVYKGQIDSGEIPVAKMGKLELDNSQFERVLGTYRIPCAPEDLLEYYPDSKHVVVIYKNHFYKMPVYNRQNEALSAATLTKELQNIVKNEKTTGIPFGLLTTDNRDNWACAYTELMNSESNHPAIECIRQSLFTVSLDECVPTAENKMTTLSEQLIYGGGVNCNSGNRWMDKTIQLIINPNGMSGFCYEHSPAEGQPIALMTDFVTKQITSKDVCDDGANDDYDDVKKLTLTANPLLEEHLQTAKKNMNRLAENLHMHILHFKGYGKEFLKQQKLSPDSFIQMALQYAFYKLHKVPGAQYESAHLRIYVGGRTETIRSCSNESMAFARAMCEGNVNETERVKLLRAAVAGHREYTNMALQGRGVDRHLLGLKLMALEHKLPIPELYKSAAFTRSNNFRLSTSQVASAYEAFMCFGPLTADGYACCYNPRNNDIILSLSAWRDCPETCADRFAVAVTEALNSMHSLLSSAGEKPKGKL